MFNLALPVRFVLDYGRGDGAQDERSKFVYTLIMWKHTNLVSTVLPHIAFGHHIYFL